MQYNLCLSVWWHYDAPRCGGAAVGTYCYDYSISGYGECIRVDYYIQEICAWEVNP